MANTSKLVDVDWNLINIWCCNQFFTSSEISKHTEKVHCEQKRSNLTEKIHFEQEHDLANLDSNLNETEKMKIKNPIIETNETCDLCAKSFKCGTSLDRHRRKLHETSDNNKHGTKSIAKKLSLNKSEKGLSKNVVVKKTLEANNNNKACQYCSFVSQCKKSTNCSLEKHRQRMHEGIRYSCDWCEYKAAEKYNLKVHVESKHQGIRHSCDVCPFKATSIRNLTQHKKRHLKIVAKQRITQRHNDSVLQKLVLQNGKTQPLSKQKRKLFNSSTEKVLICEPQELPNKHLFFSPQKKRKIYNSQKSIVMNLTQYQTSQSDETVSTNILLTEKIPEEMPDDSNKTLKINACLESPEIKEALEQDVEFENGVKVPGWKIMPEFHFQSRDESKDLEEEIAKEEALILKFHKKQEKEEKLYKKKEAQFWKRQEQIQNRKHEVKVNVEGENVESMMPMVEDITDIVVTELDEEPVLAFGFVMPKLPQAPFSLPWLFKK